MSAKVQGNHLVDGSGKTLQLRGVNVSALEFVAIQGWDTGDPWGGQTGDATPNWNAIKAWQANVVRLPLNEASWLGYTCKDASGAARNPNPGNNYKTTVIKAVTDLTAAGMYVILDLQWTAPGNFCPMAQNQMADTDHSVAFWTSVATQFKSAPNVLFELFNEPFVSESAGAASNWSVLMKGGSATDYVTGGTPNDVKYKWTIAGMQQLLTAVRNTGATNVVLVGGAGWSQDLSQWVSTRPTDPAHQMAAVWHAYPNSNTVGDPQAALPRMGSSAYTWAQSILDAGFPVIITETGDHDSKGTKGAPLLANLLPWADARNVSYLGWTWNTWGDAENVLITDAAGNPTDGYGVFFKNHLTCLAAGTTPCTGSTGGGTGGGGSGGGGGTAFWVFYNGVFNWGGDYSFAATANYKDTAGKPLTGAYDIAVTVTSAWGGYQPYAGGTVPLWNFNDSPYTYLTFAFKPTVANQTATVYFIKVGDVPVGVSVDPFSGAYGPKPQAGVWATYKIPLLDLGVKNTSVYKFAIQDKTGLGHNLFYLDNIGFQ